MTSQAALHLDLPAKRESLEAARLAVGDYIAASTLPPGLTFQVELVLEEVLMNIVWHAYPQDVQGTKDGADRRMLVQAQVVGEELLLTFEDTGRPFDPTEAADPELPTRIEDATPGGLGVMLVKKFARRMHYERVGERNRLQVFLAE